MFNLCGDVLPIRDREDKEFIKAEKMETHPYLQDSLMKMRIKVSEKGKVIGELRISGIRDASLFPEMENQAMEIKEKYSSRLGV